MQITPQTFTQELTAKGVQLVHFSGQLLAQMGAIQALTTKLSTVDVSHLTGKEIQDEREHASSQLPFFLAYSREQEARDKK